MSANITQKIHLTALNQAEQPKPNASQDISQVSFNPEMTMNMSFHVDLSNSEQTLIGVENLREEARAINLTPLTQKLEQVPNIKDYPYRVIIGNGYSVTNEKVNAFINAGDPCTSTVHMALISKDGIDFDVVDLESTYGTKLNEVSLVPFQAQKLKKGDTITFGLCDSQRIEFIEADKIKHTAFDELQGKYLLTTEKAEEKPVEEKQVAPQRSDHQQAFLNKIQGSKNITKYPHRILIGRINPKHMHPDDLESSLQAHGNKVSRYHALLLLSDVAGRKVFKRLVDLGSKYGTKAILADGQQSIDAMHNQKFEQAGCTYTFADTASVTLLDKDTIRMSAFATDERKTQLNYDKVYSLSEDKLGLAMPLGELELAADRISKLDIAALSSLNYKIEDDRLFVKINKDTGLIAPKLALCNMPNITLSEDSFVEIPLIRNIDDGFNIVTDPTITINFTDINDMEKYNYQLVAYKASSGQPKLRLYGRADRSDPGADLKKRDFDFKKIEAMPKVG